MSDLNIQYPYMPEDRHLKYANPMSSFMEAAAEARRVHAGDPLFPVGIAMVKDGEVVLTAGNGFNRGAGEPHVCPRVVMECKSGEGYELCDLHHSDGHAEASILKLAREKGIDPSGSDLYMYGHWWACEPCWKKVIDADVRDLYVTDDAHERFSRERVFAETLTPTVKSAYISAALTSLPSDIAKLHKGFYEDLGSTCEEMGISAYIPHLFTDPVKHKDLPAREVYQRDVDRLKENDVVVAEVTYPSHGTGGELVLAGYENKPVVLLSHNSARVSRFVTGNPAVVYHIQYETYDEACRKLKNVLKQL